MSGEYFLFQFMRGNFSFQVQETCRDKHGIDVAAECPIHFFAENNTAKSYGKVGRGEFEGSPDIAGTGYVMIGFSTGLVVCLLSFVFLARELRRRWRRVDLSGELYTRPLGPNPVKRWTHVLFDPSAENGTRLHGLSHYLSNMLIANADTQIFISLSYGINFALSSKCTLSAYHYKVALNMVLLALASTTLSTLMIRDYWKRSLTAASLRTAVVVVILVFLGRLMAYQHMRASRHEELLLPKLVSRGASSDSSILMPMACFLDQDLDPIRGLTDAQRHRVGGSTGGRAATPEIIVLLAVALCFVLANVAHAMRRMRRGRHPGEGRPNWWGFLVIAYWSVSVTALSFAYLWCYANVWILREWVHRPGWMEDGAAGEKDVRGISQILPIVALCWVVIWSFDWSSAVESSTVIYVGSENGSYGPPTPAKPWDRESGGTGTEAGGARSV